MKISSSVEWTPSRFCAETIADMSVRIKSESSFYTDNIKLCANPNTNSSIPGRFNKDCRMVFRLDATSQR